LISLALEFQFSEFPVAGTRIIGRLGESYGSSRALQANSRPPAYLPQHYENGEANPKDKKSQPQHEQDGEQFSDRTDLRADGDGSAAQAHRELPSSLLQEPERSMLVSRFHILCARGPRAYSRLDKCTNIFVLDSYLGSDPYVILHVRHARRSPRGAFGFFSL
jgi:hypothetical protein